MPKKDLCQGTAGGAPALPAAAHVAESVRAGTVRRSRMGRRRAWVLIGVHVVIFVHLVHWFVAGKTISPLEPSEAMFTITNGVLNAGAVLFLLSLLSTLLLGRWFCGWACHVVALQDLCAWMMKKAGITPRPLRSRALMFVPLLAGLLMFFWAPVANAVLHVARPELRVEMTKSAFWETFPGFWVGLITFVVCGFAMVYLLGAKGFCTYACPYGGFFGVLDRFAPARIVVNDQCRGCGHCTAVCTSNVQVHLEVREFGRVVDPGCMKCLDCVSVCPENALSFGFAAPAILGRRRVKTRQPRPRTLSWGDEVVLVVAFAASLLVLRGWPVLGLDRTDWIEKLYGGLPLLLALGLAAVAAWCALVLWQLYRRKTADFLGRPIKAGGRWTARGKVVSGAAVLYLAFIGHSALVQYHLLQSTRAMRVLAGQEQALWTQDPAKLADLRARAASEVASAQDHLAAADALTPSFISDPRVPFRRAHVALAGGDVAGAEIQLRRARAMAPENAEVAFDLARVHALRRDLESSIPLVLEAVEHAPGNPAYFHGLEAIVNGLFSEGRYAQLEKVLERATAILPRNEGLASALAAARVHLGKREAALAALRAVMSEDDARRLVDQLAAGASPPPGR